LPAQLRSHVAGEHHRLPVLRVEWCGGHGEGEVWLVNIAARIDEPLFFHGESFVRLFDNNRAARGVSHGLMR